MTGEYDNPSPEVGRQKEAAALPAGDAGTAVRP